jgi:hypothetical protein
MTSLKGTFTSVFQASDSPWTIPRVSPTLIIKKLCRPKAVPAMLRERIATRLKQNTIKKSSKKKLFPQRCGNASPLDFKKKPQPTNPSKKICSRNAIYLIPEFGAGLDR